MDDATIKTECSASTWRAWELFLRSYFPPAGRSNLGGRNMLSVCGNQQLRTNTQAPSYPLQLSFFPTNITSSKLCKTEFPWTRALEAGSKARVQRAHELLWDSTVTRDAMPFNSTTSSHSSWPTLSISYPHLNTIRLVLSLCCAVSIF
jgi:hypothetical protein